MKGGEASRRAVLRSVLAAGITSGLAATASGARSDDGRRRRDDSDGGKTAGVNTNERRREDSNGRRTAGERNDGGRRDGSDGSRAAGEDADFYGYYSTRGYYWWNTFTMTSGLEDGYTDSDIRPVGTGRGLPRDTRTAILFVHGWQNTFEHSVERFQWVQESIDDNQFVDAAVVGFSWPSNTDGHWYVGTDVARSNGPALAAAVADLRRRGIERIHLVAHSLGALVALSSLSSIYDDEGTYVDSLHLVSAAVRDESVSTDGEFGDDISSVRSEFDAASGRYRTFNYYYPNDDVLRFGFEAAEWSRAAGRVGCDGPTPTGYEDIEISPRSHYDSFRDKENGGQFHTIVGRMIGVDPDLSSADEDLGISDEIDFFG
ncbi:alpha/beta fold hydrolase [Natrarchaeobius sp. A-rgal3]|uniref:alpha/beta fold hydrolase n=1 Tax=Natrarchaeobius versutus TaxID=1679078 RepID=UPI0035107AE0